MNSDNRPKYRFIDRRYTSKGGGNNHIVLKEANKKAKSLVRELQTSGITEDEKDIIYKELIELSSRINNAHNNGVSTSSSKELQFLIQSPYSQNDKMIKTFMFMKRMSAGLNNDPDPHNTVMQNNGIDSIIYKSLHNCNRSKWMNMAEEKTCDNCWSDVMSDLFANVGKTFANEMTVQLSKIQEMQDQKVLPIEDYRKLTQIMHSSSGKFEKLVENVTQNTPTNNEWLSIIESLYQLVIYTNNSILFSYAKSSSLNSNMKNNKIIFL